MISKKKLVFTARLLAIRDGIIPPDSIAKIPFLQPNVILMTQPNKSLITRRFRKIKRLANNSGISVSEFYIRKAKKALINKERGRSQPV